MAAIAATDMTGTDFRVVSVTVLSASDTITFDPSKKPVLIFNNVTAGALTPLIDGDGGPTVACAGIPDVDVSGGLLLASIGIGVTVAVTLSTIKGYLSGTITITGGLAIEATLLEF